MIEARLNAALETACQTLGWTLHKQVRVGKYTLDFLVETDDGVQLIVEADGAAWHERTEDQGLKDRIRDRFLLWSFGIPTIRFLGREILKNVDVCMGDVIRCATSMSKAQRRIPHVERRHLAPREEVGAFFEQMAKEDAK